MNYLNTIMKNSHSYILLGILALGFALRVWGISFGLPDLFKYDEITYVETALRFGTFNFSPHGFNHGSLLSYILFFEYIVVYIILLLFRLVSSPADFLIKYYIANPTLLFLVGRATQVFFGLGTIAVTYLIGKTLFNKRVGLISAYLLSISFIHIQYSHYIKADILSCFLLTIAFFFAVRVFKIRQFGDSEYNRPNETKFLVLAGLFIGLAVSAKYYALLGWTFLFTLQVLSKPAQRRRHLGHFLIDSIFDSKFLLASAMIIVGFLIGQPYALLTPKKFIGGFFGIASMANFDFVQRMTGQSRLLFYFTDMLKNSLGLPVLVGSFLAIFLLTNKDLFKKILLIVSFPVCFSILVICRSFTVDRYLLAIIPFLTISSAVTIDYLLSRFSRYKFRKALLMPIIMLFSLPLVTVIRFGILASSTDTRTVAKSWIEENTPSNAKIAIEGAAGSGDFLIFWGPNIKSNLETLHDDYKNTVAEGGRGRLVQQRIRYLKENPDQITYRLYKNLTLTEETIKRIQPEYIILCGYWDFWASYCEPDSAKNHQLLYKRIENNYKKIKEFVPFPRLKWSYHYQMDYDELRKINSFGKSQKVISGPTIYVYKKI